MKKKKERNKNKTFTICTEYHEHIDCFIHIVNNSISNTCVVRCFLKNTKYYLTPATAYANNVFPHPGGP